MPSIADLMTNKVISSSKGRAAEYLLPLIIGSLAFFLVAGPKYFRYS